jgi:hypothetical protein
MCNAQLLNSMMQNDRGTRKALADALRQLLVAESNTVSVI